MPKLRNVIYLSEEQYEILRSGGTISGYTLNDNDLYMTPGGNLIDGPLISVANGIASFADTSGKLLISPTATITPTGVISSATYKTVSGSDVTPSYTFINDPGTGMYQSENGSIDFTVNSSNKLKISSNGLDVNGNSLSIGTDSSTWTVDVNTNNTLSFKLASTEKVKFVSGDGIYFEGVKLDAGAITSVTATSPITSSGGLNPDISVASGFTIPTSTEKDKYDIAYTGVNTATSSNTFNTIVKRDGSGGFSAGSIAGTSISVGTGSSTWTIDDAVSNVLTFKDGTNTRLEIKAGGLYVNGSTTALGSGTVTSVTATSPIVSSEGTTPEISLATGFTIPTTAEKGYYDSAYSHISLKNNPHTVTATQVGLGTDSTPTFEGLNVGAGSTTWSIDDATSNTLSFKLASTEKVKFVSGDGIYFEGTKVGSGSVTSVTATGAVTSSGGTTPQISIASGYVVPTTTERGHYESAYSHISLTDNPHNVTASQVGLGITSTPTFAEVNVGSGSSTWTINDTTSNVLTFKDGANTRLEIKAGGLYVNGSTTPVGSGTVTSVTATGAITSSGGTTPQISVASGYTVPTTNEKGKYDLAYTGVNSATNVNTVSTIVKRDSSGNFSAGTITASLTGTASGNLTSSSTLNATKLSGAIPVAVTQTEWDSAYTATNSATSSNTINTIVKRDESGNFSAGSITGTALNVGTGSATWTIDDTTVNVLTFKEGSNTRLEIKSGGLYVNGSTTPLGEGSVTSVSLAGGTNNGTLKLTVNGTATDNIAVKGLGSAAYTASTNYVAKNTSITGATKTKITYDAKGLVTSGADATLDDIADGTTRKLSNYVLTTRKVNGHELSSDITVTAFDVGLENVTNESKTTMFTNPTFTGTANIGTGSSTWTITDATEDELQFTYNGAGTVILPKVVSGTKTIAFTDSVSNVGNLITNNTTAQTASAGESFTDNINLHKISKTGTYSDLIGKPTIPATNVIPVTTTANKVLVSTTTSGTAKWSAWSSAGFLKTNTSGVISIDTNTYLTSASTLDASKLSGAIPTTVTQTNWDSAYSHISLKNNPHNVTAIQVGLGTNSSPTFAGISIGAGSSTWTIDDTTANVLTFKDGINTRLEIKSGGLYVNGSTTPVGSGSSGTITSVTGTGAIASSGGTAPQISIASGYTVPTSIEKGQYDSAYTATNNATNANTFSTIVKRGTSGEFSAGAITTTALNVGTGSSTWTIDDTTTNVLTFKDGVNTRLEIKAGGLYVDGSTTPLGAGWKLIRGTEISIPTTLTANNVTVVSGNYYGKTLAFEVRVVTATDSYETHIVFARMGSNTAVSSSATYDRLYSWTTFDGRYFKTHSFKAYCSNSTTSTMTIGNLKHLIGDFNGSAIAWTTNTTSTTYIEKIWLVN